MDKSKKVILITGSTDGIGKLAAIKLAKDGHHIYIHGRNPQKVEDCISEIKSNSGNENIYGFVADFSDLSAVKKMADQINSEINKIDVLINNAGVFKSPTAKNENGIDIRFVVNYLAPYLLTQQIHPLLNKEPNSRIINLSSAAQAPVSLSALSGQKEIGDQAAYAQSKLALTMWSFDLAKKQDTVSVLSLNPGSLLNTNMVREAYGRFWSPADKGSNIIYDLAVSAEYDQVTDKYFDNDKGTDKGEFGSAHPDAYEQDKIDELIRHTDTLLSNLITQ